MSHVESFTAQNDDWQKPAQLMAILQVEAAINRLILATVGIKVAVMGVEIGRLQGLAAELQNECAALTCANDRDPRADVARPVALSSSAMHNSEIGQHCQNVQVRTRLLSAVLRRSRTTTTIFCRAIAGSALTYSASQMLPGNPAKR